MTVSIPSAHCRPTRKQRSPKSGVFKVKLTDNRFTISRGRAALCRGARTRGMSYPIAGDGRPNADMLLVVEDALGMFSFAGNPPTHSGLHSAGRMNHAATAKWARDFDPVFIVGAGRSGSSLLYRILLAHSSFVPRNPSLQESHLFDQLPKAAAFHDSSPPQLIAFMLGDVAQYTAFLSDTRSARIAAVPSVLLQRLTGRRSSLSIWKRSPNPYIVRTYFRRAAAARGVTRLIEKTPNHITHVKELDIAFPRGKYLYIHRHPVDVYASYRRRSLVNARRWANQTVTEFCRSYERSALRAIECADQLSDSFLTISYERLTLEPSAEMGTICHFLGETFEPGILHPPEPVDEPTQDPHLFRPIAQTTKDWRDYLSGTDAAYIENTLRSCMDSLGYGGYTAASG
jgi:hypothetical protein